MDKPAPHHLHLHDWLGPSRNASRPDPLSFEPRQVLETMSAGFGPMKALTVHQMELVKLASRRAQAYLGVPQRIARCRTQHDLISEQVRFWQTAMTQYQESAMRIFEVWSDLYGSLPNVGAPGAGFPFPAKQGNGRGDELIRLPVGGNAKRADEPAERGRTEPVRS